LQNESAPTDTTRPSARDAARQRLTAAEHRLTALRDCRTALRKDSGDDQALMDEYTTIKQRESVLRQRLQVRADRIMYMRLFELNSPWTDIAFAAPASPN
jgi:hypothetical protein